MGLTHAVCIKKKRDRNGTIVHYTLKTENNEIVDILPSELKEKIRNGEVIIENLQLTSNNKLINKRRKNIESTNLKLAYITPTDIRRIDCNKHFKVKVNVNTNSIVDKANLMGTQVTKLNSNSNIDIFIMTHNNEIILLTSADKIAVRKGKKLFSNTHFASIDMRNIDTSLVNDATHMFANTQAKKINLSEMNTYNVTKMDSMFENVNLDELDLSSFNTINTKSMLGMFHRAKINKLNISSFNTVNVSTTAGMFRGLETNELDISNFDLSKAEYITSMFRDIKTNKLNLGDFNINKNKIQDTGNPFTFAIINELILTSDTLLCVKPWYKPFPGYTGYIGNYNEIEHLFNIK